MAGEGTGVEAWAQEVVVGQQPITGDTRGQILMVMTIQGQQGELEALLQEALLEAGAVAGACCAWAMHRVTIKYLPRSILSFFWQQVERSMHSMFYASRSNS